MLTRRFAYILGMVALLLTALPMSKPAAAQDLSVVDQYIVVLKDDVAQPTNIIQQIVALPGVVLLQTYDTALKGFAAVIPLGVIDLVKANPAVAFVDEDQVFTINAPQPLPTGINRIDADLSPTAAIDGNDTRVNVDVAVIDTGIASHPDLNVYRSVNCTSLLPIGTPSCRSTSPADGNGHGTHVAGTIGALDNSIGVVGVAPGARLWGVKVLSDQGSGFLSSIIAGVDYVTRNASSIEVANMSLGGSGSDDGKSCAQTTDAYKKAICNSVAAGVTYAVAAGNETADAATSVPAAYDNVITVSALADFNGQPGGGAASTCRADVDDTLADFSNYGADVDIIAPGTCITSTWPTALNGTGYNTISGTSMASPHVAGAAALYKAKNPGATPAQVRQALINAGTSNWDNSDDHDSIKEPLLNVSGF